jgi:thiamine-phosphate pyrophosphorylase
VAFGAFYSTKTKKTKFKAKLNILKWAKNKIKVPIVAIGGINQNNFQTILSAGADYIACSASIWSSPYGDPLTAVNLFKK